MWRVNMSTLFRYIFVFLLVSSFGATAQVLKAHGPLSPSAGIPTPVTGQSWLTHLSRSFNDTSMGKTGALGPESADEGITQVASEPARPVAATTLSGADLYRLNCRSCHGPEGQGTPPEINSVINPARATSTSLVTQSMKSRGLDISQQAANELAKEARASLLKRLHEGGENMPSFSYLSEAEIASILAYLKQLAGMPGAAQEQKTISEPPERVGELIVKSTCHICHDATGANPSYLQLSQGAIPPLETLSSRVDQIKFIRKVTHGSPILMGEVPMLYRGRMPVFYYLTPQEAASAYSYLSYYPPIEKPKETPAISLSQAPATPPYDNGPSGGAVVQDTSRGEAPADNGTSHDVVFLLAGVLSFVFVLLAGGLAFTIREFSRISSRTPHSALPHGSSAALAHLHGGSVSRAALTRYRISQPAHTISRG
jgi:mono/diheme cytochrome c family protein